MARRIFFSFHYQDVIDFRANVVRQHWVTKPDREEAGFFDASIWENARRTNPTALKRLINSGLDRTSATCVLIGSETWQRPWVRYEILKSVLRGNHIFAVHINSITGKDKLTKQSGPNPLDFLGLSFSASGDSGTLLHFEGGRWQNYTEIDGSSSYRPGNLARKYWGKSLKLSDVYTTYDWVRNDGYNNFSSWVP